MNYIRESGCPCHVSSRVNRLPHTQFPDIWNQNAQFWEYVTQTTKLCSSLWGSKCTVRTFCSGIFCVDTIMCFFFFLFIVWRVNVHWLFWELKCSFDVYINCVWCINKSRQIHSSQLPEKKLKKKKPNWLLFWGFFWRKTWYWYIPSKSTLIFFFIFCSFNMKIMTSPFWLLVPVDSTGLEVWELTRLE